MKLLYVLALMTATALAAPAEVESSQILGKRGCVPCPAYCAGGSGFLNCYKSKCVCDANNHCYCDCNCHYG
ncbi:hypothetical protein ACLOAV_006236 [Pseudogymnoascus australis]